MPRRPKKGKSASLLMRNLIKDLSPLELAVLRERIMHICEITKQDILVNPKKYERHIISSDLLLGCMTKCITTLVYEEETKKPKQEIKVAEKEVIKIEEERDLVEV